MTTVRNDSDQEPIHREHTPHPASPEFTTYYDIDRTISLIEQGDYKRIALQFPDELLHDAVPVYRALQNRLGNERSAYVLADTSYGSCCVDEVAASHVDADVLVHYGHACLSRTSRLPVIYVFGRKHLDVPTCAGHIRAYIDENATELGKAGAAVLELRHDVAYTHLASEVKERLRDAIGKRYRVSCEPLPPFVHPSTAAASKDAAKSTREEDEDEDRKLILWIGEESSTLTKLLLTSSGNIVISYSPNSNSVSQQSRLTNKLLMRRYAILQQARDADVFGILVGTLGVASYLPLLSHIRAQLKKARKKSYTLSVGKINPAKLANFMEIECWVWVACGEGMVDSKEYLRPIITPYELELALQPEPASWNGQYVFDFEELMEKARVRAMRDGETSSDDRSPSRTDSGIDARTDAENINPERDTDQPSFSLITGKYRHAKRYENGTKEITSARMKTTEPGSELIRQESTIATRMENSAALQFLQSRTYQGLDMRLALDEPSVLEQGRSGIASVYSTDRCTSGGASAGVRNSAGVGAGEGES